MHQLQHWREVAGGSILRQLYLHRNKPQYLTDKQLSVLRAGLDMLTQTYVFASMEINCSHSKKTPVSLLAMLSCPTTLVTYQPIYHEKSLHRVKRSKKNMFKVIGTYLFSSS
jgi:hypothetical protein